MMIDEQDPLRRARRRCGSGQRRAALPLLVALAASATAVISVLAHSADHLSTVFASSTASPRRAVQPGARSPGRVARHASERSAYIALVNVDVTPGDEEAFLSASLANARKSVTEGDNKRFDVLQSREDPTKFGLVEIYGTAQGPLDHKGTAHYATWRETVADMMASPRSATQWDCVWPSTADGFVPDVLVLERNGYSPQSAAISHLFMEVAEGTEEAFIKASVKLAKSTASQDKECMRFDVLRSADEPTKFAFIRIWESAKDVQEHKRSLPYLRWVQGTASMLTKELEEKKYVNHYPNVPAAWKVDPRTA